MSRDRRARIVEAFLPVACGDLVGPEAAEIAHDDQGAIVWVELLQRRDEVGPVAVGLGRGRGLAVTLLVEWCDLADPASTA